MPIDLVIVSHRPPISQGKNQRIYQPRADKNSLPLLFRLLLSGTARAAGTATSLASRAAALRLQLLEPRLSDLKFGGRRRS